MSTLSLSQLKVGEQGEVKDLVGQSEVCQRLSEMGITRGTKVEIVRYAPMGDPIDIRIRGYHLSLRLQEAQAIQVTPLDNKKNK